MAEKEACADIVASVTAELLKEQQRTTTTKSVTKSTKAAIEVEEAAVTEESETESEYEEVEIVEEVTDDSSAEEAEEVEEEEEEDNENDEDDNDDDDEEEIKTDKDENPVENSKKTVVITKTVETKVAPEKAIETVEETIVEETTVETSKVDKEQENEEQEQAEAKEQSESLLLPLLQGLLHKNKLPTRNQTNNRSSNTNPSNNSGSSGNNLESNHSSDVTKVSVDNEKMASKKLGNAGLAVHHVEDSGTESGEDLKLIAAGLRDSLQMHSISDNPDENGLISEVTTALNRLELSLREGKDLKLDAKKRNALLTLVARLQTGLISPEKITAPTPAPGQTADGDTELSSPEGDNRKGARPGHQRFAKRRNRANRHTVGVSREELADARRYIEEMVMMESISNCTTPDSSNLVTPPDYPYTIQKQNSAGAVLGNDVQESSTLFRPNQFVPDHLKEGKQDMVESSMPIQMRENKSKPTLLRQSISIEQNPANSNEISKRPYSEAYPRDKKVDLHLKIEEPVNRSVYEKNLHNSTNHSTRPAWGSVFNGMRPSAYQPAETSPLTPSTPTDGGKSNRFINKKMMMKRANTIDIPKPMKYMNEMESDSDGEDRGVTSIKAIGLRGTVQVTVKNTPRNVVPQFKPKTENDLKFLAFIQKQTPNSGLAWNNPSRGQTGNMVNNWSNKFGNIKNNFESGAISTSGKPPMPSSSSSARNFWKKTEVSAPSLPKQSPKVPSSPKTYDRTTKPAWNDVFAPESPKIFVPKPIAVNKFSHAPMSAFQPISPIPPNTEPTQFQPIPSQRNPLPHMNDSYSEPISVYSDSPTKAVPYLPIKVNRSPILPWAGKNAAGNRVHSLAASKFESKPQRHESVRVQDQTYQQRVSGYNRLEHKRPSLPSNTPYDANLQAPQMVQNIMHDAIMKEFPPLPYTSTDYTQPSTISTYIPEVCITRSDSLTNPEAEPIVLTSDRPFISPYDPSESLTSPNYTQNEVSDSDFDTDSVTEYKAESKIMRGPVSQQAVTVGNRTMRRGDEGKFGKNSKEAKSLLSFMKNVKPTDTAITSDGRSYQAPKVGSVLPTTDEVNRFTHEIIPVPQYQTNIVQGYNPIYQQPRDPKPIAGLPYQTPSPQIPVRNTPPMYQSQQSNYAVAPEYLPNINGQGYHPEPMQNNHPQPARTNYVEPPRTDYPDYPPRTNYQEPQRVAYQEPPRTNYQEHPSPLMSNYQELPLRNYQEPSRTTYPESPRSTQSYSTPQYDIPPYQEKQRTSNTYSTSNYQEVPHPETPKTLKTYPSYQEQPAPRKLKDKDVAMIQQNFTKITSAPTTPEKRTEPFASKTPNGSSSNPTTPKDESVPKLKKYGPPQLHSYRPNSYQYPLSEVPRKFSEPTVRTSSHTTITRDMARTTTLATKFIAPHIIETPSSPLALGKNEIPSNVIYNNVHRISNYDPATSISSSKFPVNPLSRSDSWHQICQQNNSKPTATKIAGNNTDGFQLRRVKSGHSLDIPKMYEAGINKSQISEKQKTVAAYFSGQKSPNSLSRNPSQTNIAEASAVSSVTIKKSSINRTRTSGKTSIGNQNPSNGLARSQTMPHIASIHLLDESNVEDAFEQLLQAA